MDGTARAGFLAAGLLWALGTGTSAAAGLAASFLAAAVTVRFLTLVSTAAASCWTAGVIFFTVFFRGDLSDFINAFPDQPAGWPVSAVSNAADSNLTA